MVATAAEILAAKSEFVSVKDLIAKACRHAPPKQSVGLVEIVSKFYVSCVDAGIPEIVGELIEYHSQVVNATDVTR